MKKKDFLIVGQGLAGTLIAHFLMKAGKDILVLDDNYERSSSRVAAGLINPITGRRFVKSWMIDELLPFAENTYRELESLLHISIFHKRNILRTLSGPKEENDWMAREFEASYSRYLAEDKNWGGFKTITQPFKAYGEIQGGAQVNLPLLISSFQSYLIEKGLFRHEIFDYNSLECDHFIQYKEVQADKIIFCEGIKAKENPFFSALDLPLRGDKGEVLLVKLDAKGIEKCLKHKIFIVPLEEELFWIGSTYEKQYEDDLPSATGKLFLTENLKAMVKIPFEIIEHKAAIRPTVKDRRPLMGRHPELLPMYFFNGLGTKGTSLGPYWAARFYDFLQEEIPLDEAVDFNRFL